MFCMYYTYTGESACFMHSQQIKGAVSDNESIGCKEETSLIFTCSFVVPERKIFFPALHGFGCFEALVFVYLNALRKLF